MKKNIFRLLTSTLLLSVVALSFSNVAIMSLANTNNNEKVNLVINSINSLNKETLTNEDVLYVKSIKTIYNSLTDSEKALIDASLLEKLNDCIVYVEDCVTAFKFSSDINYYVANPTFSGTQLLEQKQNEYNSFSSQVKSLIKNFNLANKKKILDNVELMIPEIYYDFRNPTISNKTIINQGSIEGKNAELKGNASVENGYLSFGLNADIDGSYLRLPDEMFKTGEDFTIALEYERTTDTDSQALMAFGTNAYTTKEDGDSFGFRTSIHTGYDRGPMTYLKTKNSAEVGGYTGILHANGDGCNHLIRILIRYISDASCLQICEIDTNNNFYMYVNQGCTYPSYNQYTKVKESNMPLTNMNLNVLGAYNGINEYLTSTEKSFEGKIYTFAFYNRCVTEFELFGKDNRDMYIGSQKVFEYVNNFEYPENEDVFYEYRDEYGKIFSEIYNDVLTVPYDFRFLYDQEKLAMFLEAYRIFQDL